MAKKILLNPISHNAGKFVCEGLYYQILRHLQRLVPHTESIFLHVPVLGTGNSDKIMADFHSRIEKLASRSTFS
jgi:pyroglutamyl-peptidase